MESLVLKSAKLQFFLQDMDLLFVVQDSSERLSVAMKELDKG